DATLKKSLDGYLALAEGPGDQSKARGASKAALEAVAVAQQSLVGQFWSEPKLHGSILAALLTELHHDLAKPVTAGADAEAFAFPSAWGALQVAHAGPGRVEAAPEAARPGQAETAAGALRTLKGAFPDAVNPSTATPRSVLGEASSDGAAALKSGLALP